MEKATVINISTRYSEGDALFTCFACPLIVAKEICTWQTAWALITIQSSLDLILFLLKSNHGNI